MLSPVATVERDRKTPRPVVVHCPKCGTPRALYERHAQSGGGVCKTCPTETELRRTIASYKRYWLSRYDDLQIAWMAAAIFGMPLDPEFVAGQRKVLLP